MATATMATVTMTIPDVEKDVEYTVTTLAKQRNITVAKLLRLILNEYLRQHSIVMKSTQSASTEVSTSSRSLPSSACELIEVDSHVAHGEKISTRNGQITNNLQSSADISSDALEFDQDCVTSKAKRIKTELEGHDNDDPMVDIYLSEIPSSNDHDIEEFILKSSCELKHNELCDDVVVEDQSREELLKHTNLDSDDVLELNDGEERCGSDSNDDGCRNEPDLEVNDDQEACSNRVILQSLRHLHNKFDTLEGKLKRKLNTANYTLTKIEKRTCNGNKEIKLIELKQCNTLEDIFELERKLQDPDFEERLKGMLQTVGGHSMRKGIYRMLTRIMTIQCASLFNITGKEKSQKSNFKNLKINYAILDCAKAVYKDYTDKEAESSVGAWLRQSGNTCARMRQQTNTLK